MDGGLGMTISVMIESDTARREEKRMSYIISLCI